MENYLNHPVIRYLVIAFTSVLAAVIFFWLGGSLAEIPTATAQLLE